MSTTKVSKYVLGDGSVSLIHLDTTGGVLGQVLAIGSNNTLQFEDKLVTEDVEDIAAGLIIRGNHTNLSVAYIDGTNQLNLTATGAVSTVNTQIGDVVLDTDDILEGFANLYYTDARVNANFSTKTTSDLTEGANLYYTTARTNTDFDTRLLTKDTDDIVEGTGNLYWTAGRFNSSFTSKDTDALSEGSINLYFTDQRVHDVISVTDLTGDGSLTYANGIITYTGPSATEVRAHFSAGTGVSIANGEISIGQDVSPTSNVVFNDINATNNVVIDGDLTVSGTTTTVFSATTRINENLLYLNEGGESTITGAVGNGTTVTYTSDNTYSVGYTVDITGVTPSSFNIVDGVVTAADSTTFTITSTVTDTYVSGGEAYGHAHVNADLGWVGAYDDGTYAHTGLFRDASDGVFKIFDSYTVEPNESSSINTSHASYNAASMLVDNLTAEGDITATNISGDGTNITNVLTNYTTTNLTEGTNLYFTDERVDDRVATLMTPGTNITMHYDDIAGTFTINSNGVAGITTDDLNEGVTNLYYTDARVAAALDQLIVINDTSEFGELIFNPTTAVIDHSGVTTSQIRNTLVQGTGVYYNSTSGEISIGQEVDTFSNVQFSDLVLTGNLTVSGVYTVVNTEIIQLADNIILLNSNETSAASQSGGIEIERGTDINVSFLWDELNDRWTVGSEDIKADAFIGDLIGDVTGDVTGTVSTLSNHTTDNLDEGSNLYYTISRWDDRLLSKDTDDLSEGLNLYFTEARARNSISVSGDLSYNSTTGVISTQGLASSTTDDLAEGAANLYYTDTRTDTRVNILRTDLETSGSTDLHFDNITNLPEVTTDIITGNGIDATFTLTASPGSASAAIVTVQGVTQLPGVDYTISNNTITMTTVLPSGQQALVRHVGFKISGGTITTASDSDLLDGLDSTQFLRSDTSDTMVGTLTMTGDILPSANVTYNLGSSTQRWNELWLSTSTINLGDNTLSSGTNDEPLWNEAVVVLSDLTTSIVPDLDNTYDLGSDTKQFASIYGHAVEAVYADLAERYSSDAEYDAGTVVVFGGDEEITTTVEELDVSVAGIISTSPALKMNSLAGNDITHPYVALKGRVPCKVIGPVTKGDLLVTSSTPGFAKSVGKNDLGRAVFAKAIQTNLEQGEKLIEVAVI